jgi:hypothetical protein
VRASSLLWPVERTYLIALLVALAISIVPATALASGPRRGAVYVALGDSYAAGEGLGPFQSGTDVKKGAHRNQCHRSQSQAYADLSPAVVLPAVTSRAFWACSGATTSDMESVPPQSGRSEQYQQPKQTQTVGPSTQWISLSAGGDDLGFGAIGTACGGAELSHLGFQRIPGQPPCTQEIGAQTTKLAKLKSDLEGLYNNLLIAAPQAKLVVVGYPRIFPSSYKGLPVYQGKAFCILDHSGPVTVDVGVPVSDAQAIDRFEVKLNSTIQQATTMATHPADAARIKYADTYDSSVPRNCKGTTPHASVAGLVLSPGLHGVGSWFKELIGSGTFHPTADGQRMMAGVVEAAFNSFPTPTTQTPTPPPTPTPKASWTTDGMSFNVANYTGNLQPAAVSCPGASECVAVGSEFDSVDNAFTAVADEWRGSPWEEMSLQDPSGVDLFSVSCPTVGFCMAVGRTAFQGDESSPVAERWQNGVWTAEQPPPSPDGGYANLLGVSCASESACIAVGMQQDGSSTTPFAEQWSSGSWTVTPMPEEGLELDAVSCVSATWCWAVGGANQGQYQRPFAEQWNGSQWVAQSVPGPEVSTSDEDTWEINLRAISCTSITACVAAGAAGTVDQWNGQAWTLDAAEGGTDVYFTAVACSSAGGCIAVGNGASGPVIESESGSSWHEEPQVFGDDTRLSAVAIQPGVEEAVAVGYTTTPTAIYPVAERRAG